MKPIFLNTETDKLGNKINIFRTDTIAMSPVYTFFLRSMAELIDNGHAFPFTNWNDGDCAAIYAEQDGKVLGHIVYSTDKINEGGFLWIVLSAVDKDARGRGIYTIMHNYFEERAKQMGCWSIASHIHRNNTVRLESAAKVGMKPIFYFMGKKIQ